MREESFISGVSITGMWRWKTVIVPPNMYVVHTRRGVQKPLHVGLGISFKFNPNKDSFLVVPSAMQTIVINANSICKELQGILVQAYVQWIIEDFETSYKRLDFSDVNEPMRVVNVQLREQAEAAIQDAKTPPGLHPLDAEEREHTNFRIRWGRRQQMANLMAIKERIRHFCFDYATTLEKQVLNQTRQRSF